MKTYLTEYTTENVPPGAFGRRFAGPDVAARTAQEAFWTAAGECRYKPVSIVSLEVVGHYPPGDD